MELITSTISAVQSITTTPLATTEEPWNLLIPWLITLIVAAFGPFVGAFASYILSIRRDNKKREEDKKVEWKKTYKKEHAYLERYFYNLRLTILDNKKWLSFTIKSYQKKEIEMSKLADLPIRDDVSMRIDDKLFMNRVETYLHWLKRINRWQEALSRVQNRLNEDILVNDPAKLKRAENSIKGYIESAEELIKFYDYVLDAIDDLIVENVFLLKKYKKWEYNKKEMANTYKERMVQLADEKSKIKEIENPLMLEQENRLKKFGLYPKTDE